MELVFIVIGSEPEPYRVVFRRHGSDVTASCTCRAGSIGQNCKHRLRILYGDVTDIVSDNAAAVVEIAGWLSGTELQKTIDELCSAESEMEQARTRASRAKKKLTRLLNA